jgi:vacuolar-type H+-ATPase subunit H
LRFTFRGGDGVSIASLLLEEKKAMMYVEEARRRAQEIIQGARAEAERILKEAADEEAARRELWEYAERLKEEAERILSEHGAIAERIKAIPDELIEKAASLIVEEVLKHEL